MSSTSSLHHSEFASMLAQGGLLRQLARRALGRPTRQPFVAGRNCDLRQATILNYSGEPERLTFDDGVKILGEIEVFERGRMHVGAATFLGRSKVFCATSIDVGEGCWIADNVFILDSDLHPRSKSARVASAFLYAGGKALDYYAGVPNAPVNIGRGVWIGVGAIILKGVTLGEGAIVAAGSVVSHDVPEHVIVAGNPAKPVGTAPD